MTIAVSVIIPIYNGMQDLPDLAACLLAQTFPAAQVEFLLVDNHSQDGTWSQLQDLSDRARQQGVTVRPLSETAIQSSYAARNRGIRAAQGDILVFTDADCRPEPTWLTRMVAPFDAASVGLVVGEIKALPGDSWLEQFAEQREILSQKFTIAHSFYPYGQTANLAVRKVALQKSGLFRPYLTTGGDADLCWRIQMTGDWKVHFAQDAIIRHRHRSTLKDLGSQWRRYGRSNRYLHELFDVPLQPESPRFHVANRLTRWLLKGLPVAAWRSLRGQAPAIEMVGPPLDLFCGRSRELGQRTAKLPEAARDIEWLEDAAVQPDPAAQSDTRN
ncbi:glycosyltransferase [Leptolyngbya iicbica]|uniref:Glycosyltransferase n=2 Tax=Cyanophyceae TaxID=3028117 RepID=A0A4Q7E7P1_9CYAN|nr:glycosyltransferase [Leptolyngbya sp. LK]RZM78787.1 glycosyltransferase [Leptolyngbya sp. LK]